MLYFVFYIKWMENGQNSEVSVVVPNHAPLDWKSVPGHVQIHLLGMGENFVMEVVLILLNAIHILVQVTWSRNLENFEKWNYLLPLSFDIYCTHNEIIANVDAIYCEWNEWESGACSKECGGGIRTQVRTKKVEEAHGGTCEGEHLLREPCNQHECPSKLLNFPYDYLLYCRLLLGMSCT